MKNTQRKYHKKIMYTFKIKYFNILLSGGEYSTKMALGWVQYQLLWKMFCSHCVPLWSRDNSVATTSSTHRHVANMSSPIRQEDASGRHDVASGRQCIVRKLSAIASGRDRVVSRSSYVRLCVATGASIGRQYVVKQIIWRCTGDALAIFDDLAVVKTLPVHRQTSPIGVKGALV